MKQFALITALFGTTILFSGCSTDDVAKRQQGLTDTHAGMMERREARLSARDQRFNASRDSWMN